MSMANGSAQTSSSSKGGKVSFKPVHSTPDIRPTIPTDHWHDNVMPRGRFKVTATKNEEPMLTIPIRLGTPDNDEHESYKGAEEALRIVFYADAAGDKTRSANMSKLRLRGLCEAVGVDYDEVYPASIESEEDLHDLISALENKKIPDVWTTHRVSKMPNGEETINVDIHFKEPGSGFAGSAKSDEEEEKPAAKKAKRR